MHEKAICYCITEHIMFVGGTACPRPTTRPAPQFSHRYKWRRKPLVPSVLSRSCTSKKHFSPSVRSDCPIYIGKESQDTLWYTGEIDLLPKEDQERKYKQQQEIHTSAP